MTNNKQQTAVEWLVEQLTEQEYLYWTDKPKEMIPLISLIEQAKEMEKQQIIKAWKAGDGQHDKVADKLAEQWYEKTYGGNK